MSLYQIAVEYILVYCTAVGLAAVGEPSLAKNPPDIDTNIVPDGRSPMPVWMVFIFVLMAAAKWFISFLIQYVYLVITTVQIVANQPIHPLAAAQARTHGSSQRARLDHLIQKIRVLGAFKAARADRLNHEAKSRRLGSLSVSDVKADLRRRSTIPRPARQRPPPGPLLRQWQRITGLACFRGLTPLLTISTAQWVLAFVTDFLLSGHPENHKFGYGTTSLVLQTVFASAYAVWTHYTITKPSNKRVFDHFPKGGEVLVELWPMTALWGVAEHLCLSGPLAVSRFFGLKRFAFDPESWNGLSEEQVRLVLVQFGIVFALYGILVAVVAVPMTMIMRRVHASMLSDDDLAIVPFNRGNQSRSHSFDERAKFKKPGLSVSEAWATITWRDYIRVLGAYGQYFVINQAVQMLYWGANWELHQLLRVERYSTTKLPWSPVGVVKALSERALPEMGDEDMVGKMEL